MYKKAIILAFTCVVIYFWIAAIFSEKNSPENMYSFRMSQNNGNKPFPQDPRNQANAENNGGQNNQPPQPPQPQNPPQGSPVPPPPGVPTPVPPPPGNPVPNGSPAPPPQGNPNPPGSPAPQGNPAGDPAHAPQGIQSVVVPKDFKMPETGDLAKHQELRMNLELDVPKDWTVEQSDEHPEFTVKSPVVNALSITCRRSKVMEGRSFQQEVDAILKNETEMKKTGNLKKASLKIEDNNALRFDFEEYPANSSGKSAPLVYHIYLFVEHEDEAGLFIFSTPYALKDKALPLFEKIMSSIVIIKRPPPG